MSSVERWTVFFKDAGIPSVSAKNYVSIFDDNRITKEMLMDLDKEILREMGISIMGDVIAILKHAKKVYTDELKKKDSVSTTSVKSSVKVAPMINTSVISPNKNNDGNINNSSSSRVIDSPISVNVTHPPKSSLSSNRSEKKLDTISADVQYTTAAYKNQQATKNTTTSSVNCNNDAIPPYGSSLHSDKITTHGFVKTPDKPVILEEYTTSTYEERMKNKRTSTTASLISRTSSSISPTKPISRIIVIPSSLEKKPHLDQPMERSKRFLEAAGIMDTNDSFPVHQAPKHSVFSRLELSDDNDRSNMASLKRSSSDIKGRLGKRVSVNNNSEKEVSKIPATTLYFEQLEERRKPSSIHDRLGPKEETNQTSSSSVVERTMVADNISQHSDVHARLKKQGVSLLNTSRGPLGKRLGQHAVFGRLE